jgi:hypothetical protein
MNEATAETPEQLLLTWEGRIRLLANSGVWKSILMAFGIPSMLLGVLVGFVTKRPEYGLAVPLVAMAVLLTIYLLVAAVIDLFGGFKVTFFLTTRGVRSVLGRGPQAVSTTAILMGLFTGKHGGVATGVLAKSEQNVFIPWTDITKIKVSPGRRSILIKREWGYKPIELYCTPDNFPEAMTILRQYAGNLVP